MADLPQMRRKNTNADTRTNLTTEMHLIHLGILIVIAVAYALILARTLPNAKTLAGSRKQKLNESESAAQSVRQRSSVSSI